MTSDLMAATNVIVACTSRMWEVFGRMCRKMIVYSGTPIACAASTYSSPRNLMTSPRIRRPTPVQNVEIIATCIAYGLSCIANTIAATNR